MPIRRGTALVVVGIAAILLLAFIFVVPALMNVDRYRPTSSPISKKKLGSRLKSDGWHSRFFL